MSAVDPTDEALLTVTAAEIVSVSNAMSHAAAGWNTHEVAEITFAQFRSEEAWEIPDRGCVSNIVHIGNLNSNVTEADLSMPFLITKR
jgi:hypothetical protein